MVGKVNAPCIDRHAHHCVDLIQAKSRGVNGGGLVASVSRLMRSQASTNVNSCILIYY